DYDEVFAPVARIEAIRLFLAFASYVGFIVYQMDVKSAFLYGEIEEEVYVTQPKGFKDPHNPKHVYRVVKALYGLHQAPRACQDKYVKDMLKKFDMESMRTATTPYEVPKPKSKDEPDDAANVHLNRSMIGSLMYLTAFRPDIMFAVSACSRHQVTPMTSHLNAVKKIFKYLKGQPNLGLWHPRDSSFQLEAYSDSDYAGSHGDRKSITCGCQFLGRRLKSWQCKKQTNMATSSTKAKYVAVASCCGQVLWIQNQMLDYGFNFMNTKIFIDNHNTICIVKNLVFHQRTKHIEIRHHFIKDANEKNLIQSTLGCSIPRMNAVSCGFLLYSIQIVSMHHMLLVVQVFLLVVLVHADGLVPAGSCIIPNGSYSFMLLDWFLLVLLVHAVGLVPTRRYVVPAGYVWILLLLK
nr:putative reverse transcriptase, RNA-dependent DNA polymerase [Tanacetum cinerariifolium]